MQHINTLKLVINVIERCISTRDISMRDKVSPDSLLSSLEISDAELIDIIMKLDEEFDMNLSSIETDYMYDWNVKQFTDFIESRIFLDDQM